MKTYEECEIAVLILGTGYTVLVMPENGEPRFKELNCGGFCDYSTKKLYISNFIGMDDKRAVSVEDVRYIIRHTIRREMVHAFLYESGLGEDWTHPEFGHEETTVDWIARQLDKMHDTANVIFAILKEHECEV